MSQQKLAPIWISKANRPRPELLRTTQQNISLHIQNVYAEGELEDGATHKKSLWVRQEGNRQEQREYIVPPLRVIAIKLRYSAYMEARLNLMAVTRSMGTINLPDFKGTAQNYLDCMR
jgi:hypothetical protein